jgi:hypothetical protein
MEGINRAYVNAREFGIELDRAWAVPINEDEEEKTSL